MASIKDLFKKKETTVETVKEEVKEAAAEVKEAVKPIASFKGGKETGQAAVKPVASFKGGKDLKEVEARVEAKANAAKVNLVDVANQVIRGDFGNGEDRKSKLEAAGYNYDEVQAKVNEIMSGAAPAAPAGGKSIEELAKEVIRGDWGNGDDRKAKLEAAGYNYAEIQAKVNELLK